MAMSDTGSSFAQWAALYHHHDPAGGPALPDDDAADAGIGTAASPTSGGSSGGSPTKAARGQQQLLHGVEGPRVAGKPAAARRRSRASRRAPVTLLNTDAANFRAMVQQFTGIPAPLAGAFGVGDGAPLINFAADDYGFPPASYSAVNMTFDHQLHHRSQHHHPAHPHQEQLHRQQQQYAGASPFGSYSSSGASDVFASHGFAASAEDRMLLQSIQAAQMPPVSGANASTHGFFA